MEQHIVAYRKTNNECTAVQKRLSKHFSFRMSLFSEQESRHQTDRDMLHVNLLFECVNLCDDMLKTSRINSYVSSL